MNEERHAEERDDNAHGNRHGVEDQFADRVRHEEERRPEQRGKRQVEAVIRPDQEARHMRCDQPHEANHARKADDGRRHKDRDKPRNRPQPRGIHPEAARRLIVAHRHHIQRERVKERGDESERDDHAADGNVLPRGAVQRAERPLNDRRELVLLREELECRRQCTEEIVQRDADEHDGRRTEPRALCNAVDNDAAGAREQERRPDDAEVAVEHRPRREHDAE